MIDIHPKKYNIDILQFSLHETSISLFVIKFTSMSIYNGVGTKTAQDVETNVFDPSDIYLLDDEFRVESRFLEHPDILNQIYSYRITHCNFTFDYIFKYFPNCMRCQELIFVSLGGLKIQNSIFWTVQKFRSSEVLRTSKEVQFGLELNTDNERTGRPLNLCSQSADRWTSRTPKVMWIS